MDRCCQGLGYTARSLPARKNPREGTSLPVAERPDLLQSLHVYMVRMISSLWLVVLCIQILMNC
jgi:hypothetical protein